MTARIIVQLPRGCRDLCGRLEHRLDTRQVDRCIITRVLPGTAVRVAPEAAILVTTMASTQAAVSERQLQLYLLIQKLRRPALIATMWRNCSPGV